MFLPQTAEYALRAMAYLALLPPDLPIRAKDLSRETGIPGQYLSKILRRLVLAGLLRSQKGQGGGFKLARPPGNIRFMDVLAAIDCYPTEGRCVFGWGSCNESSPCPLHDSWHEMSKGFRDWAENTTLDQIRGEVPSR